MAGIGDSAVRVGAGESGRGVALSQTVDVETPELVVFSYTIAGIGSRAYAALIDFFICIIALFAINVGIITFASSNAFGIRSGASTAWAIAAIVLVQFLVLWGYYVVFEALFDGQTPGKRSQRLRVVRDGGYSVTFGASAVRNLVRVVDMQPFMFYGVGILSAVASRSGKRLGDMVAGTIVVKEDLVRRPVAPASPAPAHGEETPAPLHTALSDTEYELLDRYMQRRAELDAVRREQLAHQLAARFAAEMESDEPRDPMTRLVHLHDAERAARARGVAAKNETGAARERHTIVASGSARWSEFAARLAHAQRGGLSVLGEGGVRDFVSAYREITADLARLRTAARGRDSDDVFYLNRLVSGAHNLLYRRREIPLSHAVNYFFVDVPREIRASVFPVAIAAVLLFGPAVIVYTAVVRNPDVAATLLPPQMLDRADDGVRRAQTGRGYISDPQVFRPVMASSIVANNVQVAIAAFGFGITAGVLTLWILVMNSVSLGAVFGLYASKGIGSLLLAFVAPHGVLELFAICVAGGGGFLLASAILLPGQRTRKTALVENGRRAIRLLAGAGLLLVVAGIIEGFVSPIEWWPIEGKLAVSGATAVGLYVYLRLGT